MTLYATGAWSHCMSIEDASRCVEGSIELYIELYIEDVEARAQGQTTANKHRQTGDSKQTQTGDRG